GLQKEQVPEVDNGNVKLHVVSGSWNGQQGPVQSLTGIEMVRMELKKGGSYTTAVAASRNILFYVMSGKVQVNGQEANTHTLVQFANEGEEITIEAMEDTEIIFGHGEPYNEPIVAHGPFVMNSQAEIMQAMRDYQMGKMGVWTE
ncbi:MAG: pirin family protein, partial [Hymenobacteraceae bacterium]|nr:pirin family protein [Hymenobacteraceae bacterium]MDX5396925.1 pirin family protein [Hymenobacteraceae bacterium]MDX5512999.1 pirin family protein [Hymenobacteraceae bacterium]